MTKGLDSLLLLQPAMNCNSFLLALSQISYLVDNLTKKSYRASQQKIQHIMNQHGPEADRHLLGCLFSHVDFSGNGKSSGKDFLQVFRDYRVYKSYPQSLCKFAVLGIIYEHYRITSKHNLTINCS